MKLFFTFVFLASSLAVLLLPRTAPQAQSLSLPSHIPVHCSGAANNCYFGVVGPGETGMVIARQSFGATLTDNIGDVWTQDQCTTYVGDCIFSTHFTRLSGVTVTFPAGTGTDVYLLVYEGTWKFDSGQFGTYQDQNSVFSDCTNGNDCPYNWTLPVDAVPGALLVSWADADATGPQLARAGFGFSVEASDGLLAVEDMIAPVAGVYIGNLEWRNINGSESGGSHWFMGIAEYRK